MTSTDTPAPRVCHDTAVVFAQHAGHGTRQAAQDFGGRIYDIAMTKLDTAPRVAVLHDLTLLTKIDEAYAMEFSKFALKMGDRRFRFYVVAPKAWMRVLVRVTATLGGIDLTLFRNVPDATDTAAADGFSFDGILADGRLRHHWHSAADGAPAQT